MPDTSKEKQMGGTAGQKTGRGALVLVATLVAIYMISQFFRNSINVIGPDLAREFDLDARALSLVASMFFFSFALVQIPLGMAIDRFGPKICLLAPAAICIAGTLLFALARSYHELVIGRVVIGVGCSSFLMAPLAIYAERFAPERFGSLVGIHVGAGNFGALLATAPLAASTAAFGWRWSFAGIALIAVVVTALVALLVREGESAQAQRRARAESLPMLLKGVREAAATRSFWPVFAVQMTAYPAFGSIVGLWSGPWLAQVYGMPLEQRGNVLFVMALAQIMGLFVWGAADRLFGSYKRPCLIGGGLCVGVLTLAALTPIPVYLLLPYLIVMGLVFGFSPALTAHGKALFPRHLIGRGLSLMNIGAMGGVFFQQWLTGQVMNLFSSQMIDGVRIYPAQAYQAVFGLLAAEIALALLWYSTTRDPHPGQK